MLVRVASRLFASEAAAAAVGPCEEAATSVIGARIGPCAATASHEAIGILRVACWARETQRAHTRVPIDRTETQSRGGPGAAEPCAGAGGVAGAESRQYHGGAGGHCARA